MMRKTKTCKFAGLLAAIVLLVTLLAACSESTATSKPATTTVPATASAVPTTSAATTVAATSAATAATTTAAGTPVVSVVDDKLKAELTVWTNLPDSAEAMFREQIQRFGKMYPNVKLNPAELSGDEMLYQLELGKTPDLILAPTDYVVDFTELKALQQADKALDKTFLGSYNENALSGSNLKGTQYGIPFNYGGAVVMLYNKKLVSNPPATVSELVKVAGNFGDNQNINTARERVIGLAIDVNEPYGLLAWLSGFGGAPLDAANQPTLNTPQMVNALKFTRDLVYKERMADPRFEPTMNQIEYAFCDGRLAMFVTLDSAVAQYSGTGSCGRAKAAGGDEKLELAVAPLPKVDETGKNPVPYHNGRSFFIGAKNSGDKLNATKVFLDFMAKPQQQAELISKAHLMPVVKTVLSGDTVKKDPLYNGWLSALEIARPQPAVMEMRVVWDSVRSPLQSVVADTLKPEDAARKMQQTAQEKVKLLSVK